MKIAIIGAGISGLGAGVILSREHEVHLFEAESRLGGHAHTIEINEANGAKPAMDVGFLVFNELTYPHLCGMFRYLGVETCASNMSLSIQNRSSGLEWSGSGLNSVFAQRRNLLRPRFLGMLKEILRFHREAEANLSLARASKLSLDELLILRGFSLSFTNDYLLPIGGAIWSMPEQAMLSYPAETFLNFFINHRLLQIRNRPVWRTVSGGSQQYVNRAKNKISRIYSGQPVREVVKKNELLCVHTDQGEATYDRVIFATHAPTSLKLLRDPSPEVATILQKFRVQKNVGVLHTNPEPMPRSPRCWAAWNVRAGSQKNIALTYWLNLLQPLATRENYFLSLNSTESLNSLKRFEYNHPHFDRSAITAQAALPEIQGKAGIYFTGAWTRYGFHEDGLRSAVLVARMLGVDPPWEAQG